MMGTGTYVTLTWMAAEVMGALCYPSKNIYTVPLVSLLIFLI